MPPLTLLIGLAFAAVLLLALAAWLTLTAPTRAAAMARRDETRVMRDPRLSEVSNDVVRGAKAPRKSAPLDAVAPRTPADVTVRPRTRPKPRSTDGDPFERFLERGRKRDEF